MHLSAMSNDMLLSQERPQRTIAYCTYCASIVRHNTRMVALAIVRHSTYCETMIRIFELDPAIQKCQDGLGRHNPSVCFRTRQVLGSLPPAVLHLCMDRVRHPCSHRLPPSSARGSPRLNLAAIPTHPRACPRLPRQRPLSRRRCCLGHARGCARMAARLRRGLLDLRAELGARQWEQGYRCHTRSSHRCRAAGGKEPRICRVLEHVGDCVCPSHLDTLSSGCVELEYVSYTLEVDPLGL